MLKKTVIILAVLLTFGHSTTNACTVIAVGKKASADGSVIISQTDNGDDCRIRVVPAMDFPKGAMTPVYWGIQNVHHPLDDYGDTLGFLPQVQHTYQYFHSAYSHMNEHQLAIAESTTSMRHELYFDRTKNKQIMTIEQAMIFALQRYTKAKEAVKFIGHLMDKYGFLPSDFGESETIVVADPDNAWVFEVVAVGKGWDPKSGKPGAIWAAQRIPDDKALIIPNWLIIKQINIKDTANFMASSNYESFAVEKGWYHPNEGKPFVWQNVYAPVPREWATERFWLFNSSVAPHYYPWPPRRTQNPYGGLDDYHQYVEPLSIYPFAIKPEKKISIRDVVAFQRSVFHGTIYDMSNAPQWYVPGKDGKMEKSPLATPFPTTAMRKLLKINNRRNIAKGAYGMIAQLRSWLPDPIGGVYWVYQDNQHVGMYFPLYCGITKVNTRVKDYNPDKFNPNSIKWAIDFVDNLLYLRWQDAYRDVVKARTPLENRIFNEQNNIDSEALALYKKHPKKAREFLTKYSWKNVDDIYTLYTRLRFQLLEKYTNNKQGINFQ